MKFDPIYLNLYSASTSPANLLRLLCLCEDGGPVGFRGEDLGFRGKNSGFLGEDSGSRGEGIELWGEGLELWGILREKDFGLSYDGIRAFVGRDWLSWDYSSFRGERLRLS